MKHRMANLFAFALLLTVLAPISTTLAQVPGSDVLYTTDADFDQGTLVSVNHDAPYNDQLQLDSPTEPFPFINVAASGRGTVVRVNTETGEIVGEYRTAPEGRGLNPSRTTVDLFGNVWTANRDEVDPIDGVPHGSAVKIGLIVGGTRVDESGSPDPAGGYLAPPFGYNTCVDRDADGLIRTSVALGDILEWPDITDGVGGPNGVVEDAEDECILVYQRLPDAEQARHVSVDADNNVWVGGFPFEGRLFHKLAGIHGAILDSFDARDFGCGGYGGLIDGNGILWSIGWGTSEGALLRYDPVARTGSCVDIFGGYGLGIDTNGYVWGSIWDNGIAKVSPDGFLESGFPKSTYQPSGTTTAVSNSMVMDVEAALPMMSMTMQAVPAEETPTFWAAPSDDWVGSMTPWTPGATISLTIEDGSGVIYSDSQTADGAGVFNFNLWDVFDLHAGHVVTVSDGTTIKSHTVMSLFVDGVDVTADRVSGRADPGSSVEVWVHGDGGLTATADSSGDWIADFSGMTDLTFLSEGGSGLFDVDGDATGVWWAAPRFQVSPDDDWIQASGKWLPGATISLTIENGSGVVYSDSQTADADGYFNFELWDVFDLQRGHVVTVSDGTTTKTHTVMNLFADGVDVTADTVFGRADAGSDVDVWVHGVGDLTVTADGAGNWTADFSGVTDLTYLSDGGSQQWDTDGDSTGDWWASPRFQVNPDDDWVAAWGRWNPGVTITLTIDDGSGTTYSDTTTVDDRGEFWFGLTGIFDLERGHVVTVSDGTTTKTHEVRDLFITDVNAASDVVYGTANPNSEIEVQIHEEGPTSLMVTSDGSGNWSADFAVITDVRLESDVTAHQYDAEGDVTWVPWRFPMFRVWPDNDRIEGSNWQGGTDLDVSIAYGGASPYETTARTEPWGDFGIDLLDFDIETGHEVTITDGRWTKVHKVTAVTVTDIDVSADTVTGTSAPFAGVTVDAYLFGDWSNRSIGADSGGTWLADFSVANGDRPPLDITEQTYIDVAEYDADADATVRSFGPPVQANRGVAVTPIDNHVWVANSGVDTVTRLDNDGNILEVIDVGDEPTGVAVDAAGKVWVTNLGSDNTVRIDPTAGADGLGAVDLTVDLGPGASPYNYSDMTGAVVVGSTSPQGFWTVIQDSGEPGFEWGRIAWNTEPEAFEPPGTEIIVEARTADTEAGLGGATFVPVVNGELFSSFGRYIEARVTLKASPDGVSPVLSDIRVQPAIIEVDIDIKPGSYPNSININRTTGVVPVAVLGSSDFDVTTIDVTTLGFGPAAASPAHDMTDPSAYLEHLQDVNADGYVDLIGHYPVADIGLTKGETEACIGGATLTGIPIAGCDSVRVIGRS